MKLYYGKDIDIGEYVLKIRLIPFSSLGKENGMLIGIKADSILIDYDGESLFIDNVIIGVYDGILTKSRKYKALIGLELLEYQGGVESEFIRNIKV